MKDLDFIHVGTFSSPVGLKGEIKVNFLTSSFEFFKNLKEYFDENHSNFYIFKNMRLLNNKLIVHPENCYNREDVNRLKGKKIYSKFSYFPKIKTDQYYLKNLIGYNVNLQNGLCL